MSTVAALFVETGGCYFGLAEVDPWDLARDARASKFENDLRLIEQLIEDA